jgi:thymidine phosphorylase
MTIPQEIIRKKRNAEALNTQDIKDFVQGITDGSWSNEQISALAMAIYFESMTFAECADLTLSMRDSGDVVDWQMLKDLGPVVDKHSTGGIGDKVSLMMAPTMAACGCYMPMIAGRGLGHTGGTVDKFEAIPGYRTDLSFDDFQKQVKDLGVSVIGQTDTLAPADRRFYSIRSITSTVESVPLITASILSKKLAAGLDYLILDVKFGTGAFIKAMDETKRLAKWLSAVGNEAGCKTKALLTDMNQVLGRMAGNSLEVIEAVEFMKDPAKADPRLYEVHMALCAELLEICGKAKDRDDAEKQVHRALHSGKSLEIFAKMVHAQGGPVDFCENYYDYLPRAAKQVPVYASETGFIDRVDAHQLGVAIIELGGGRKFTATEAIDHATGLEMQYHVGDYVEKGDLIAMIHGQNDDDIEKAKSIMQAATSIGETKPRYASLPTILDI